MLDWQNMSEEEAIEAAIDEHGKDATTSVAYCALEANTGMESPEDPVIDLQTTAAGIERRSCDDVRAALLDATYLIRTLRIILDD